MTHPDDPGLALYAARTLTERLAAVRRHIGPVRAKRDAEAVHQMRVASRRLRAALKAFDPALPAKPARRWRKQIKRVTKALGAARDLDVQIAWLDHMLEQTDSPRHKTGLRRLRLRLDQNRQAQQPKLEHEMDRLLDADVLRHMPDALHELTVRATRAAGQPDDAAVHALAQARIEPALDEMLAYDHAAAQPHLADQLHQLRIAAKKLRYTMEIFAPAYAGRLDKPIKHVRKIQSALGDVHDMDVWIDWLPRFLEAERNRTRDFQGHLRGFKRVAAGIEHLREHCIGQREHAYEQFLNQWRQRSRKGTWTKLRRTLHQPPDPTPDQADAETMPPVGPPHKAPAERAADPPQIIVPPNPNDTGLNPAPTGPSTGDASKITDH